MKLQLIALTSAFLGLAVAQNATVFATPQLTGGWTKVTGVSNDPNFLRADGVLKANHPQLQDASIVSVQSQVVNGYNYKITYQKGYSQYEGTVYIQPRTNSAQETMFQQSYGMPVPIQIGTQTTTYQGTMVSTSTPTVTTITTDVAGGWTTLTNYANDADCVKADRFARANHAELKDARIVLVQSQVVSGTNYRITYSTVSTRTYVVTVYIQPWTNTIEEKSFVQKTTSNGAGWQSTTTTTTVTSTTPQITGGWSTVTNYSNDASFSKVDTFARSNHPELKGARILMVESQVVSGTNYKVTYITTNSRIYVVVVYIQPWTNTIQEKSYEQRTNSGTITVPQPPQTVTPQAPPPPVAPRPPQIVTPPTPTIRPPQPVVPTPPTVPQPSTPSTTVTVTPPIPGGWATKTDYANDAKFAEIDRYARSRHPELKNARITLVEMQVVSGFNYRITYTTSTSTVSTIVIYSQPWTNTISETSYEQKSNSGYIDAPDSTQTDTTVSNANNVTPSAPGSWSQSTNYANDADFIAADQFLRSKRSELRYARVVSVETQVVSGMNYRIIYQTETTIYYAVVYVQSWTNTITELSFTSKSAGKPEFPGMNTNTNSNSATITTPNQNDGDLCKTWSPTGTCKECAFRAYFLPNTTTCAQVSDDCADYNRTSGQCTKCYGGFTLTNGQCFETKGSVDSSTGSTISSMAAANPFCLTWANNVCKTCANRSVMDSQGMCVKISDNCQDYNKQTGQCNTCYKGFTLIRNDCVNTQSQVDIGGKTVAVPAAVAGNPLCASWDAKGTCKSCAYRSYFNPSGICVKVDENCQDFDAQTGACKKCYRGWILGGNGCYAPAPAATPAGQPAQIQQPSTATSTTQTNLGGTSSSGWQTSNSYMTTHTIEVEEQPYVELQPVENTYSYQYTMDSNSSHNN